MWLITTAIAAIPRILSKYFNLVVGEFILFWEPPGIFLCFYLMCRSEDRYETVTYSFFHEWIIEVTRPPQPHP